MNIASRGATMAVDWEQRIDFDRLRTDRLERAKAVLEASDLGVAAAVRPEQPPLRHEHRDRDVGARQEHPLRAPPPRRRPDPLGLRLGRQAPPALLPVAAGVELARLGAADARRDAGRDRGPGRARRDDPRRAARARARERAGRHGRARHDDAARAPAPGARDRRLAAGDARGAQAQDRGRARAARPGRRDRRRGLRGDLPDAAPGGERERGRRRGDEAAVRARLRARRGDQRDLRRPLHPASAHVLPTACCAPATRASSTSSTRSWATGRATTARSTSATRRRRSSTPTSSAASGSTPRSTSCGPA